MSLTAFINVRPYQTRVACAEGGKLKQIFYHRKARPSLVGALYKGRVIKIKKSLNFAFVQVGLEKSGFLYGKDIPGPFKDVSRALRPGQNVLVQIKADPIRNKGVRLSMEIGLPGLYLVYLPEERQSKNAISRQISSPVERDRLSSLIKGFKKKDAFIVRTFAEGKSGTELEKDLESLKGHWKEIKGRWRRQKELGLIQQGEDPLLVFLRDSLSQGLNRFVVDERESTLLIKKWLKAFQPDLAKEVEYYKGSRALFENFRLEVQAKKSLQNKVSLKSGGFLIFEELEAFSVIDVNSGRFEGGRNLSKNLFRLNMEAAKTIAEQVRLRGLGGIILVDFVDMEDPEDGKRVVSCLERGFRGDKSYPRVFPMGELGLVQITRKRSQNSLTHFMTTVCPSCLGTGRLKTASSISADLFLKAENFSPSGWKIPGIRQKLKITCHPEIKKHIEEKEQESLDFFKKKLSLQLLLEENSRLNPENFRIEKI